MRKRMLLRGILTAALTGAILLLCACGQKNRGPESDSLPDSAAEITTTALTETQTETQTETASVQPETTGRTMESYAAVTDDDPSAYQHRNYSGTEAGGDEEHTLPTVETVHTTVPAESVPRKTTAAQTTSQTAVTTVTTTVPMSARVTEMNRLVKNYKRNCAVLLTAADGTVLYSYQPDTAISGASLIKLPYVYFCCQQLSAGVRTLQDSVTYTSSWYHGGSGIIRKNGYNKTYTVAQLIDYALRYSDNVAYDMLVYLFGMQGFNDMVRDWGFSVQIGATHFPPVTARFMTAAMMKMQAASQYGKCWQIAWDALTGSVQSYVRDTLGITGTAVKYGLISTQYHETCYIPGEVPCTLVILSGAVNYKPDVSFVQNVSRTAKAMIDCYAAQLHAETTTAAETETAQITTTETAAETAAAEQTETAAAIPETTALPENTETTAEETAG